MLLRELPKSGYFFVISLSTARKSPRSQPTNNTAGELFFLFFVGFLFFLHFRRVGLYLAFYLCVFVLLNYISSLILSLVFIYVIIYHTCYPEYRLLTVALF